MTPAGMYVNHDGYLRIHKVPLRGKMAHRAYMERCIGRPLRRDEEVHHLCGNRQCWPPTDFHLVLMDAVFHHASDAGRAPHWKRKGSNGTKALL
jgi:hypothetical protein